MSVPAGSILPGVSERARPLVVVAEDDDAALTMMRLMLELTGFDVVATTNGRDALDAVVEHGPDAVVSDLNMPLLDGLGLCRAVRALRRCVSLPVILWSSVDADDPRVHQAMSLGGVDFRSKMLPVTTIRAALWQVLEPTHPIV